VLPGWDHRVGRYLKPGALPALYTYDFGDDWQHEVQLEAFLPADGSQILPRCLAGEGLCPPEDCGGPVGGANLLKTVLGGDFTPETVVFDDPRARWERAFRHD
jgi:hypothetical protein